MDGESWDSGGTAGHELASAFRLGPEPGLLTRQSTDVALFTSDLTGDSVELRQSEFVNLGCVIVPE